MKNPQTDMLVLRAQVLRSLRSFFDGRGFLEVETPLRIPANAPEEHIDPCPSDDQYLQTSPEMCMKRLLSRGYRRIYQISHCWRYGERGSRHVPEFTMLEWYRADNDYTALMRDCEDLLAHVARECLGRTEITYNDTVIKLAEGADRVTVTDAFCEVCDEPLSEAIADGSFDEVMVDRIEPSLVRSRPVLLIDYPIQMAALARPKQEDPAVAERFELYAGGLELANGFSELTDPVEQRRRFQEANQVRQGRGLPPLPLPEPFLRDLATMPPAAGIALGVDRLVMLLGGATCIDEVLAFTPEDL